MLYGVDRLPAPAYEQAHVLALDPSAQHSLPFLNLNLNVKTEGLGHFLEQLLEQLRGLELLLAEVLQLRVDVFAHRRLPERFFFLRGGRGGGAAGLLSRSAAALAPERAARPKSPPPPEPEPLTPAPASAGFSDRVDFPFFELSA